MFLVFRQVKGLVMGWFPIKGLS